MFQAKPEVSSTPLSSSTSTGGSRVQTYPAQVSGNPCYYLHLNIYPIVVELILM